MLRRLQIDYRARIAHGSITHPQCRVPGTTMCVPCHVGNEGATLDNPSHFYDGFDQKGSGAMRVSEEQLRAAVDLPHIGVMMPEMHTHAVNINHNMRDLLFLVSLARHVRLLGWRTFPDRPAESKRTGWMRGMFGALEAAGLLEQERNDVWSPRSVQKETNGLLTPIVCTARAVKIQSVAGIKKPSC